MQSKARRHYVLVGHSPAFDCGPDYNGRTFVEEEAATFHLFTNGSLRGSFPGQNVSTIHRVYPSVKVTNILCCGFITINKVHKITTDIVGEVWRVCH